MNSRMSEMDSRVPEIPETVKLRDSPDIRLPEISERGRRQFWFLKNQLNKTKGYRSCQTNNTRRCRSLHCCSDRRQTHQNHITISCCSPFFIECHYAFIHRVFLRFNFICVWNPYDMLQYKSGSLILVFFRPFVISVYHFSFLSFLCMQTTMKCKNSHCGTRPGRFETSNHSLSRELGNEGVREWVNEWARWSARAKQAARSKQMSKKVEWKNGQASGPVLTVKSR